MKKIIENKKIIIVISIIILVILMFFISYNNSKFIPKSKSKKEYIYTGYIDGDYTLEEDYYEVPIINLKGEKFDKLNASIRSNYNDISKVGEYDYDYEYSISNNILALKITYAYYENENSLEATRYFQTIHIDLKDGHILSDDDILSKYKITKEEVNSIIENDFKTHYENLVNGKFYTKDKCNYDCFLNNRGITNNYLDGVSYYIQDGVLTAFKFYYSASDYLEQQYFNNEDYQFIISE